MAANQHWNQKSGRTHSKKQDNKAKGGNYGSRPSNQHPPIPSPYNFVPLSPHIFKPDWGDQVSQDVPFSDAWCGWFDIEIEAKSPIYIRNGGEHDRTRMARGNDESERDWHNRIRPYTDFYHLDPGNLDSPHAIPGSSLKGILRGVLEIASFGRFQFVADHRYGLRDMQNTEIYGTFMTDKVGEKNNRPIYETKVRAGWLSQTATDTWEIIPCEFARVDHGLLEALTGIGFFDKKASARKRYTDWENKSLPLTVKASIAPVDDHWHSAGFLRYRNVSALNQGNTQGTIVFTGHPTGKYRFDRQKGQQVPVQHAKHMEFVFFDDKPEKKIQIPTTIRKDFQFIHSKENGEPNEEWSYWSPKLRSGGKVPVFYLTDENTGKLSSFGLAMMYRLPYKHTIHDLLNNTSKFHLNPREPWDLAELMFGSVRSGEKSRAIRGRVSIEPAVAENKNVDVFEDLVETSLGSPKPTYYPNYIEQNIGDPSNGKISGHYKTYMDGDARLRGWKRYSRNKGTTVNAPPRKNDPNRSINEEFVVRCRPLKAGARFRTRIHVHNLRHVELGALFWAIQWGGDNQCLHALGMGKPFGWGSVSIRIDGDPIKHLRPSHPESLEKAYPDELEKPINSAIKEFKMEMDAFAKNKGLGSWDKTPQIRSLLAMAHPETNYPYELRYPILQRPNEFVDFKGNNRRGLPARALLPIVRDDTPKAADPSRAPKLDDTVVCVLLEERTKKGKAKLQIKGAGNEGKGCFHLQSKIPLESGDPANAGKEFTCRVEIAARGNMQFKWISAEK